MVKSANYFAHLMFAHPVQTSTLGPKSIRPIAIFDVDFFTFLQITEKVHKVQKRYTVDSKKSETLEKNARTNRTCF